MTEQEYWKQVIWLAKHYKRNGEWASEFGVKEEDDGGDDAFNKRMESLSETIDGHEYTIYYTKAADVLRYTDNADAYEDCFDELPTEMTYQQMACPLASMAMYTDVCTYQERHSL